MPRSSACDPAANDRLRHGSGVGAATGRRRRHAIVTDLFAVLGIVFVAELGDKSQLLALALAARHRAPVVLAGIAAAAATMMAIAVVVGGAAGQALPQGPVQVTAGLLFIGFGIWALREPHAGPVEDPVTDDRTALLATYLAFLVAEFGDKTMLATITLAATHGALPTWVGATAGMTLASSVAILVGNHVGARLPERLLRMISAGVFVVVGVLVLADALAS